MDIAIGLGAVLLLILGTGFFVAGEFSLLAVERSRVEQHAEEGHRGAISTLKALQTLSFQLSGAQLGITVTSLIVGFIARPTIGGAIEPLIEAIPGVPESAVEGLTAGVALTLATAFSMVFGELVPKNLAIARPIGTAYWVSTPFRLVNALFKPIIVALNAAANRAVRLVGVEPREELDVVRSLEELQLLIQSSGEGGTLLEEEFALLRRSISFGAKTAADALIPRVSVDALQMDATIERLTALALESGHSRFPVYENDLDTIVGVVYVKDIFPIPADERAHTTVASLVQEVSFYPESRPLASLLVEMRRTRKHIAVIVDEHGGTAGIITIEDLLEEIVGDIEDEYDPKLGAKVTSPIAGTHVLSGLLHPDEVFDISGFEMPAGDFDTLAGFLLWLFDRIPAPGDHVAYEGWEFKVSKMEKRRIDEVLGVAPAGFDREERS
ncbi:MAG: HlyC/CorC family transporter [Actinobacteria bacterium]|nr:HlyC/CorC family transporter [Actinomycetota bacterium]